MIADGKRGDIGSTARAYAAAFLEPRGSDPPLADALTVNPYLGTDSMDPFLSACRSHGAGLFVLVRTSNAGGRDLQEAVLSDGTRSGATSRASSPSGAPTTSASGGSRASAPSSAPRCRA